uniref:Uncharacterized protein n=1 Tax=Lepeophtheirus salmonis TaxID=72036 RepID=A0A0K2UBC5_LEPSM
MLESGTSVGDIAQTLAKQKLLSFIGKSPTDVSKSLLKLLRSGDKINKEAIQSTLKSGGLDPTSAGKALLFQKALKSLGLDSKTVVAFISLQKEMMNEGKSPKEIASLLEKLVGSSPAEKDVQKLIQDLSSIELSAEDIMSLSDLETEVNRSSKKSSKPPEQAMKDLIEISSKKNMSPSNLILIQKLVNRLGISLTDVAKLSAIQKDMYESGASPQDIALALSPALPGPEFIGEGLKDSLMKKMEACDVNDCVDLSDAVKGANMSTDLMSKIILIQSTIEAQIISPEKSSEEFCKLTQGVRANKEELSSIFKKILSQNGVSPETLKKLITFEKAIGLCGTESETIFALNDFVKTFAQNFGADEKSVEDTLRKLFFKEDVYKSIGKKVNDCLSSSESSKMSKSELSSLSQLFEKIKNPGFSSSSISIDSSNDLEAMLLIALQDHPLLGGSEKGLENLSQILFFRDLFSELSIEKSKEMGNGMRILNKIWKDGDPLSVFETLQEVIGNNLEPFDLKLLQKVISGQVMPSTSTLTQFSSSLTAKSKLNLNSADDEFMDQIFNSALNMASLSDDDISKAMLVQKVLSASGVSPEVLAQVMAFQKEMLASGTSYQELAAVLEKMSGGKSEDLVEFLQNVINGTMTNFENKDVENLMKLTASLGQSDASFLKGMDPQMIAKALMVQKLLSSANLDPQDLGKVMFLQQSFVEAGSSYDKIAACMERSLFKSGMTLEHMLTLIEIELKSSGTGGRKSRLSAREIKSMLSFNHVLGSGTAAVNVMRKLNPDLLKLLETTVKYDSSSGSNFEELLSVMEDNFGPAVFQQKTIDALVVNAFMEKAGASKDEVEELMLMMMNKGGGVSQHFVNSIQEIMKIGGNMDMKLDALKLAMEEESNSLVNSLRNVFMCKDPTSEDLMSIGNTIAMKLNADNASKNDVKLALIDILDEALQDVLDYELDSNLIFNYLMLASLAMTTHMLEEKGGDLTGESIQSTSKEEIINLLERLLQEAELQSEVPKLAVYGKSFEGIKELLDILLSNESTRSALKRQVAFLFNFEEIENTTVLGLTLQEILKESKHILRPWDILKHRKILGLKTAKVPKLTYSQVYCFYKVLPEHTDGPPIGLSYE